MSGRDYERLPVEEFGRQLIESGDLDPVYIALHQLRQGGDASKAEVARWLVAYWCLYHCGAASHIAEHKGGDFWVLMMRAAENQVPAPTGGRWPRGHERRHFRGEQGTRAVRELCEWYPVPEGMILRHVSVKGEPVEYRWIAERVRRHRGFGPWIAFKVADMLDRLDLQAVDFTEAEVFMFKDPVKAAELVWKTKAGVSPNAKIKDPGAAVHQVVEHLTQEFSDLTAPPRHERPVGLQEVETVLCKWKSHVNGHYPLWNDTDEIHAGLEEWAPHSELARRFQAAMPRRA